MSATLRPTFTSGAHVQLNFLGSLLASLGGVGQFLQGYRPKPKFRGPTAARRTGRRENLRGHMAKAARAYQVRYTHMISRRKAQDAILELAKNATRYGEDKRAEKLLSAAATFPW